MAKYAVVSFDKDNTVSVVPSCWLTDSGNKCYWPPYKDSSKVVKAMKNRIAPQDSWEQHSGRVLVRCDDYAEARKQSKKAEHSSDLQSEGEYGRGHRGRIKKRRNSDSSSSDSGSSSSTSTIVIRPTKKKRLSPPPNLDDVPPLQRHNATLERPSALLSYITTPSRPRACSETPDKSKETKQILRAVARCEANVDELHEKVNTILEILNGMKKLHQGKPSVTEDFAEVQSLIPVKNLQEFNMLSDRLESDASFVQLLHHRLVRLGGSCVKIAVKYIIDACLTNEMQTKFNWEGRLGWKTKNNECKTGFKNTNLCSLMTRVLLDSNHFTTTEDEIARTTIKYLRNAADRCGGRKRRSDGQTHSADGSSNSSQ